MPTIWTYLRATAVVVGSSAALLTGGIAHADPVPAPAPAPDMSAIANIPQQLIASAANAPQILQNLATALGATPPAAPQAPGITFPGLAPASAPASPQAAIPSIPGLTPPAAAAPTAPAATPTIPGVNAPIPGLTAPAAPAAPAAPSSPLSIIPGLTTPAAPASAAAPAASAPGVAKVEMPAIPGLPLNVPSQISLPRDLPALANGIVPGAPVAAPAPAAPAAPAPAAFVPPSLLSALP